MRNIDLLKEIDRIKVFIQNTVHQAGFQKTILGLSGGIDSALVAVLCTQALGSENVIGLMMPYKNSNPLSLEHAKLLADKFNIATETIPITDMVDAYFDHFEPDASSLRRGNRMARERMCILYDLSAKYHALVAGTSNKSEIYTGYCTQFGDSACAFEPIAHLYKTEVWKMAKLLKIPAEIITKPPTADLWDGQTDEKEMGISYHILDEILYSLIDAPPPAPPMNVGGEISPFSENDIKLVMQKINNSSFKREMPGQLTIE